RGDEEEEEGSQESAVKNGSLTSDETVEEEENSHAQEPLEHPTSTSNNVMDLSGVQPASNKRAREGEEDTESPGDCEAPPTSRPRLDGELLNSIENHRQSPESSDDVPKVNGVVGVSNGYDSDNVAEGNDEDSPVPAPIKELSPEELAEKMKLVRQLQVELRNEEMKLVLLKKVRQSQVMKENVSGTANDAKAALTKLPSNTTATKLPPSQPPPLIKHDLPKVWDFMYCKYVVECLVFVVGLTCRNDNHVIVKKNYSVTISPACVRPQFSSLLRHFSPK
ncbi:hypothetical protein SK128_020943, partial [Halocaridina rubra]